MYENILEKLTKLGNPKVLLVGDFMLDIYVYGDAMRISPEAPVPVLKVVSTECKCGGAASVAADLCDLGAMPICVGVVGQDEDASKLLGMLGEIGADTSAVVKSANRPTTSKKRLVGLAQHRHQQQLMRIDRESDSPLTKAEETSILNAFKDKLKDADIVCLQDYKKGVLTATLCKEIIDTSRKAGKKVLVDPPYDDDYSKFAGATVITPNRKETSQFVGFEVNTIEDAQKASKILIDTLNLEAAVITLDKDGAYLKTADSSMLVPTVAKKVYDVAGAGDMVLAAMAAALAEGWSYEEAVCLSNIAGGLEVEKFGVATVSRDEILAELYKRTSRPSSKVVPMDSLSSVLHRHRITGQKIVFTNGCFDVIHRGHIEYLKFAKSLGEILVLGLNSDQSIRNIKGPERPINSQDDRAEVLAELESIDYISIFDDDTPIDMITKVCPDILVKGEDWKDKGVVGREFVEKRGGKVVLAKMVQGKSSTGIIEKMKNSQ